MSYNNDTIWHKLVHKKAVKRTLEKFNSDPDTKLKVSDIKDILRGISFYIQAISREMVLPEHYKKKGGIEFIGNFGTLSAYYYVTLHHMYLNGEFTEAEWKYIRYEKYNKQFNNYFKYYDNKGKYIRKDTYHPRSDSLEITRRTKRSNTKRDTTV